MPPSVQPSTTNVNFSYPIYPVLECHETDGRTRLMQMALQLGHKRKEANLTPAV